MHEYGPNLQRHPCMLICYPLPSSSSPNLSWFKAGYLLQDSIGGWLNFAPSLYLSSPPSSFLCHSKNVIIPSISASHFHFSLTETSPTLSSCCVVGLQLVLRGMSEALVDRRAAPALITLCSGPELWVNQYKIKKTNSLKSLSFCWLRPYSVTKLICVDLP